jgi:hypothetical protein
MVCNPVGFKGTLTYFTMNRKRCGCIDRSLDVNGVTEGEAGRDSAYCPWLYGTGLEVCVAITVFYTPGDFFHSPCPGLDNDTRVYGAVEEVFESRIVAVSGRTETDGRAA